MGFGKAYYINLLKIISMKFSLHFLASFNLLSIFEV
jgi:hypothetical protein